MFFGDTLGADTYLGDAVSAAEVASTGSWRKLHAILTERAPVVPAVACPNDGEPYRTGPDGRLHCPFDGYRPAGVVAGPVLTGGDWGGLRAALTAGPPATQLPDVPPGWGSTE